MQKRTKPQGMTNSQVLQETSNTVHPDMHIYHIFLVDHSTAMNEDYDEQNTYFEFYRSEIAFLMKEDKFSNHFSFWTASDQVKMMFEELKSRNQVFKQTQKLGTPYVEILNIDGIKTINQKIESLANYVPEKSKIFLHVLLSNEAQIMNELADNSESRNEYLKEKNVDFFIICANIGEIDKFRLKQALGMDSSKDIYIENLKIFVEQQKQIFGFNSFLKKLQADITNYQITIDQTVTHFLEAQNICQREIKKQIKQKISESNKRSKLELEKSIKAPERIGVELLDQIDNSIPEIHELMHKAIITVYQIAKRITYDFDLLKQDTGLNDILKVCKNKIKELDKNEFNEMKEILKGFILEYVEELKKYYIDKINTIMQVAGSFIYEFLELVLSYKTLFKNHIQRMEQGLLKVPEHMKDITQKVSQFREVFTRKWKEREKKRESIQGYIFDVHMANIIIIFRNYKIKVLPETWGFLEKFKRLFLNLEQRNVAEDNKLLKLIKQFKDSQEEKDI